MTLNLYIPILSLLIFPNHKKGLEKHKMKKLFFEW